MGERHLRAAARVSAVVASVLSVLPYATTAQTPAPAFAALSSDTVEMGHLFELTVDLPIPAGSIVFFPDTLPTTVNVESAAHVRVAVESASESDPRLVLTYPMIAFGGGALPVPGLDILVTPRGERPGIRELPGGSVIGDWSDAPPRAGSRVTRVPRQGVWVTPVFSPADLVSGVEPMPPRDVAGGSWSWPSVTLLLLCASLLAVTLVSTTKGLVERAASGGQGGPPPTREELRERALLELDRLLAEDHHRQGRLLHFYGRSSDIVRGFVEGIEGSWSSSLTTTELMHRLRAQTEDGASDGLVRAMGRAEVVKFGRLRPGADPAEAHWRVLREWVDASGGQTT